MSASREAQAPAYRTHTAPTHRHEVRYQSLFDSGRALAFPCTADGKVNMDSLSARALCNYLFARALVGRDFATPMVVPSGF